MHDFICTFDEVDVKKSTDTEGVEKRVLYGWASSSRIDADNEQVIQQGLDFEALTKNGWANWNHDSTKLVGIPTLAELRDRPGFGKSLYTEIELLPKSKLADDIWDLAQSLKGTNRTLGQSLEGKKVLAKNGRILKAKVLNIAVTPNPKNPDTSLEVLTKALVDNDLTALESLSPVEVVSDAITARIESIVSNAFSKALPLEQLTDNSSKEDYLDFSENHEKLIPSITGDNNRICIALKNIADRRGGKLTKAEAALFLYAIDDTRSLYDCMFTFGL